MDKKEEIKVIVPLICLLLSIILWVYVTNVENKTRTTEITKIPVELVNTDSLTSSNLALTPNQNFYVNLKVEGNTNDINKIKKSDFKVQVDLSEYAWKVGENKVPVSIIDYPITVSIKNTNALSIAIKIENMVEKTMNITSNINIEPKQGYFASEAIINPEEVKIKGAESLVNKVSKLIISDTKEEVHEDIVENYEIIPVDENNNEVLGIDLSEKIAMVEIKVSKGKSVKVNVKTSGELPSGIKLKSIEANKQYVEILGPKEILDTINELNTEPIYLSSINGGKIITMNIILPEGVTISSGEGTVDVTINVIGMITKDFNVKYTMNGSNEGIIVTPSSETVNVKITAFEDEIEKITEDNIKATLDISKYKEEGVFEETPSVVLEGVSGNFTIESVDKVTLTIAKEVAQNNNNEENISEDENIEEKVEE